MRDLRLLFKDVRRQPERIGLHHAVLLGIVVGQLHPHGHPPGPSLRLQLRS